jgi:hypothetical protein
MANNRFNRQVTPKGYQKGGSVKKSPMGSSSTKGNILHGKLKSQKELKKITDSKKYKDASYGEKTKMLNVATMKKGGKVRMGGGSLKAVPAENKGLKKLPTEVRNKMGYMNKGGKVKKLMTPKERAEYVKKAKVSLGATAESLQDKLHPKKKDRLFQKHDK